MLQFIPKIVKDHQPCKWNLFPLCLGLGPRLVDQAVVEAHPGEDFSNNDFDSGETSDDISNSEGLLSILPEVNFDNTDLLPPASNPIIEVTYSVGVPVVNATVLVHTPPLIHSAVVVHDAPEVYCPRGTRHDPPMPLTSPSADLGKHR